MKRILLFSLLATSIVACAIRPVSNEEAKQVPVSRILDNSYFLKETNKVFVTIKRDQGHVGSACKTDILIDGNAVATLKMSEKIEIFLTPESHIISSIPKGVCGGGIAELQIDLTHRKSSNFRVGYDGNATHRIQPTVF